MPSWVMIIVALLARFFLAPFERFWVRKGAKEEARLEKIEQDVIKQEKARVEAYREKKDIDGLSDSDLVDRLRRRNDDWGRL